MLFLIDFTSNKLNISNQNGLLYLLWYFLSGGAEKRTSSWGVSRVGIFSPKPLSPSQLVQCFRDWNFVRGLVNDVQIRWVYQQVVHGYKSLANSHLTVVSSFAWRLCTILWSISIPLCSKRWYCDVELFGQIFLVELLRLYIVFVITFLA